MPSAELRLPDELPHPRQRHLRRGAAIGASAPASSGSPASGQGPAVRDTWYGFYPNGRESTRRYRGGAGASLAAVYAIGPGIDKDEPAE